jgi:dTMP kinase
MPARGIFIVLEGIDGSGKGTQLEMLARAFRERGIAFRQISFPRYDGFFGKMVAQFLNGEYGALDPHFSALLYAGDRLEAKPMIEAEIVEGRCVLADRYVGSNLAHQTARVPTGKRKGFLRWLKELEYEVYGLPAEDLVIYLRVPASAAHQLVGKKGARKYTRKRRDILEASLAHLETASKVYDELARQKSWVTIECANPEKGSKKFVLRPPEEIHAEVLAAVEERALVEKS